MRVKVCGNTEVATALAAVEAGADALGFIMAPGSPRTLTPQKAREITREMPRGVDLVGVFVDAPAATVAEVAAEAGFTAVQLHGRLPEGARSEGAEAIDLPVLRAIRVGAPADAANVDWAPGSLLLADSHHPTLDGGTGRTFPWEWVVDLALRYRLLVSGGLGADNVGDAVRVVRPWGVDASSRLESSPGVKDAALVRAYVAAARRAEEEVFDAA